MSQGPVRKAAGGPPKGSQVAPAASTGQCARERETPVPSATESRSTGLRWAARPASSTSVALASQAPAPASAGYSGVACVE
ncbi:MULTISPECIES: hypothetical protein [unclassified Streptomyces]|uniref:hypothetical protein n=1 Tax=unclassified Streptomyces TaxID=2593676 RepID=UPI002D21AA0A|nr:hypothetical protein [Streptomyces sp. SA3_actG]